tara:strand:- start:3764 stop:4363 length:600 start_codon:yes stop_codon:yes gene_type:complete
MENKLNSGTIEALQPGQCLLLSARKVASGSKIQLAFAEKIQTTDRPMNALSLLNASDSRFSSGARRAWVTAEPEDANKQFGIDFSDANGSWYESEKGEMMDLNILMPAVTLNGAEFQFRIQIVESDEANEWENDNIERAAKRAGKNGDYILHNGNYIFSRTQVVLATKGQKINHSILESDTQRVEVPVNQGVELEELDL